MGDDTALVAAHVDTAAALLGMPLDDARRAGVIAAMSRLAAFAADIAAVPLADDVEIAGVFVP
jgi:Protein of unknown function (DUF4089)